jgi:hypothetical protein
MSRLPDLERVLFDAAEQMAAQAAGVRAATQDRRRRSTRLLAALVSLVVGGGAVAAATGLLDGGDPVPPAAGSDPELREDAVQVCADRAVRDEELLADLAVGRPLAARWAIWSSCAVSWSRASRRAASVG